MTVDVQVNDIYISHLNNFARTQIFCGGSASGKSVFLAQRVVLDLLIGVDSVYSKEPAPHVIISVHNTPFKPMPASPLAIWPVSKKEYRGAEQKFKITKSKHPYLIYKGNSYEMNMGQYTESLSTISLWMIALRGTENDIDNIILVSQSSKFWSSSAQIKQKTLEKYFNLDKIFGSLRLV